MKKALTLLIVLSLLFFAVTSCSKKAEEPMAAAEEKAEPLKVGMVTDSGTIDDKSFNQGTWEGIQAAQKDMDIEIKYLKPTGTTEADYLKEIGNLYDAGYKFIVTPGFKFETAIYQAQSKYEDANFVLLDGIPHPGDYNAEVKSNTVSIFFAEHESGFLAGVAAALQLQEGQIGFIGGMEIPPVQKFNWGFQQGVDYANENLGTAITIAAENVVYQGSFDNVAAGQQLAAQMFDKGIDAIFCAAGGVGVGAINEAKARAKSGEEVWIIGVDVDQYAEGIYEGDKSIILTSAMKRIDRAAYDMIEAKLNGTFPGGQTLTLDATNGGVSIPDENPNLSSDVEAKVAEVSDMLKAGDITVLAEQGELIKLTNLPNPGRFIRNAPFFLFTEAAMEHVVEMLNIRKEFPGIVANDNVSIDLRKGEILALLGENGAGKSTLMSILFGLYKPDRGSIRIRGEEEHISNPTQANDLGIGMVHQHFKLVHNFTITENIVLGLEPKKGLAMDLASAAARIRELSEHYGLNVDPDAVIEDVSVGMQQRVEILKMLYRNAEVLIFDEPTSVLTPQEIQDLIQIMRNLIEEGKSIILITHKLKEIKAIADRCTVIRRGKVIGTVEVADTSEAEMARMMVGREVSFTVDKEEREPGEVILEIENLSVLNSRKVLGVNNFSLQVKAGEILGLAGVDGNGQSELVEALTGLRPIESGRILLNGKDISSFSIMERIKAGMAHIPEDRQKRGLVLDYSVEDNMILEIHADAPYAKNGFLQREPIRSHAKKLIEDFDVRAGKGGATLARSLSGGNQQKAIVGREIDLNPELLIAVQPTRGLDVGSIEYIHKRLVEQRDKGKAVLLVSLELDEVLDLSDRIAIISHGELVGLVNADETNENEVGLMMAGVQQGESA